MRKRASHLLILLLALCVGFQSTVSAMGSHCPHAGEKLERGLLHALGDHHGHDAGASGMRDDSTAHPAHAAAAGGPSAHCAVTGIGSLGCHCSGLGCVSSGVGIASLTTTGFFETAPVVFDVQEDLAGLRVAHGLDLIRPPSQS